MDKLLEIFGARAFVYLGYEGEINDLADKICEGMMLPKFNIEANEDPPYELYGSCEALGFEIWLENSSDLKGFPYSMKMETEHSIQEIFHDKVYDLSPWLARYISDICEIDAKVKEK